MKQTMKYLIMAALVAMGAIIASCAKTEQDVDPVPEDNIVVCTTTVNIDADGTKALTSGGVKTFAEDETMAIVYKNTSGNTVKAVSAALTAGDISGTGENLNKSATFTFELTNPNKEQNVTYIYPAAMAKADGSVNYDALATQDGTLTTLSSNLDLATYSGAWNAGALPTGTLANQLAILAITLKNSTGASEITGDITGMTISDGTNNYSVTRSKAAGPIFVAINPTSSANIDITATDGAWSYTKSLTGKTYAAGNGYNVSWKMTKEKKDASVTAPTAVAASLTYSGSAQTLFSAGSTTGGTMKYKVTTTNSKPASTADFKTTIDQGTNAGTYYLWYYVDGGDDYNTTDVNGTAVTKAIGKAAATLTCSNNAISFSSSEATNSTKTRSASCTGGTISVSGGSNSTIAASYSSGTITLTRKTNSAVSSTTITVSVTPDANHTAPSNVTFSVSATDTGVALSASSVGYVVATDALCYPAASFPAGKTKAGVVVYKSGSNGLVVSLTNLSSTQTWNNIANSSNNPKTLSHTPAVSGRSWVCGTKTQYSNMWGGGSGCSSWNDFNTKITNAGGTALGSDVYWSCTEDFGNIGRSFYNGVWSSIFKSENLCVRPCFAF